MCPVPTDLFLCVAALACSPRRELTPYAFEVERETLACLTDDEAEMVRRVCAHLAPFAPDEEGREPCLCQTRTKEAEDAELAAKVATLERLVRELQHD